MKSSPEKMVVNLLRFGVVNLTGLCTTGLDYGNEFNNTNGSKPYTNGYRMYRMAMNTGVLNNIFTNNLSNVESWSNFSGNSRYIPSPTPNTTSACQPPYNIVGGGSSTVNEDFAEDVLNDSLQSFTYPDMASYMLQRELFAQLDADSVALQNNVDFADFYSAMADSALGQLYAMDESLAELNLADSTVALLQLALAQAQNSSINTTTFHETNEQTINNIYLIYVQYGWDSLNLQQKEFVEELAKSCIYTHGYGVLKARNLWANMEPGLEYDDLYVCTQCGNNKTDVFAEIKEYSNSNNNEMYEENEILLQFSQGQIIFYPNPATNILNVQQKIADKGTISIVLIDNLGRTVKMMNTSENIGITTLELSNIPIGIYTCKVTINNENYFGKITVTK